MRSIVAILAAALTPGICLMAQAPPAAKKPTPTMVVTGAPAPQYPRPSLPEEFAGWVAEAKPQSISDPAQIDNANAAALKEYGCTGGQVATYKRGSETLSLKLLTFHDLSGAYGAYTFYRQNGWPKADIGEGATSDKNRVLFWKGTTVVDATFSHIGPMSAGELRDLSRSLSEPQGNRALPPPVLGVLPQSSLQKQTTHFAQGPAGYGGSGGVLPPEMVGFDLDAEAVTANYSLPSGVATLTLIDYPTPQMAEAQEKKIREYLKEGSKAQTPFTQPLQNSDQASLEVSRSGPIVALVSGDAIPDESHKLLAEVHYSPELTQMPQPRESEVSRTSRFLMGVASLVIIGCSGAILLGFFLGGGRALYRIARGKPASTVYDTEFIRLHLED